MTEKDTSEKTELQVIQPDLLIGARDLVAIDKLKAFEKEAATLKIQTMDDRDRVCGYLSTVASWIKRITSYWSESKRFHWIRYQAISRAEKDGVDTVPGTERLTALRELLEKDLRIYDAEYKEQQARRQAAVTAASNENRALMLARVEELRASGDFAAARELRDTIDALTVPVLIPQAAPAAEGVYSRKPLKGTVTSMRELIAAIANGTVELEYDIPVRGKPGQTEKRPLLVLDNAVLSHKVREMGESLNWPGVEVKEESGYAVRTK